MRYCRYLHYPDEKMFSSSFSNFDILHFKFQKQVLVIIKTFFVKHKISIWSPTLHACRAGYKPWPGTFHFRSSKPSLTSIVYKHGRRNHIRTFNIWITFSKWNSPWWSLYFLKRSKIIMTPSTARPKMLKKLRLWSWKDCSNQAHNATTG